MAKVQHTCTGCVPIDASIIDVYVTLVETNKFVSNAESSRSEAEAARVAAEAQRTTTFANDHGRAVSDHQNAQTAIANANAAAAAANAAGITSANATVDANTGTPYVDVSLHNKNLSLSFHNMKGEKGDKGDKGDGAIPVVNDLTTGGVSSALSAEMGKTLNASKQDSIPDLDTIRSGAAAGAESSSRPYDSQSPNGMGYLVLEKDKTFASQVTDTNTIYEIRYDFNLGGNTVTIPVGCVLKFNGGSLSNGTIVGNDTIVDAPDYEIFKKGTAKFRGYYTDYYYNFKYVAKYDGIILSGTWENKIVSPQWNGLLSVGAAESSFQINNHIALFGRKNKVELPENTYYVYGAINVSQNADFHNATLINIGDFSTVEDATIPLPSGATATALRSLYGLVRFNKDDAVLENLTINCNASSRNETYSTFGALGVACGLSISNNHGFKFKNINIYDCPECGICSGAIYDCIFEKVKISNVGEHGIYHHAVQGTISFIDCDFSDWSNGDSIIAQRGASAAIKYAGLAENFDSGFNSTFKDCRFICTNNKTRALFYSEMPPKMVFNGCVFGENIGAFNSEGNYAESAQRQNVMVFDSCEGLPAANPNHTKNLDIYLYGCRNAKFSFQSLVWAENCDFLLAYRDSGTTTVDSAITLTDPVVIRNCTFRDINPTSSIRETHTLARKTVRFEDCSIDHPGNYTNRGTALWTLNGVENLEVVNSIITVNNNPIFSTANCRIVLEKTSFIAQGTSYPLLAGTGVKLFALNCSINSQDSNGVGIDLSSYTDTTSWKVQGWKSTGLNKWERTWEAELADGETTTIPSYRYFHLGVPKTIDLTPYVEIVPVSNFTPFTYSVTNNGSDSNSIVTINNGSQTKIKYRFKLNFTTKPV